jgi:hypothetical protein
MLMHQFYVLIFSQLNQNYLQLNYFTQEVKILEHSHPIQIVLYDFIIMEVLISCTAYSNTTQINKYL